MEEVKLTAAGKENLEAELKELKTVKRPEVVEKIKVARSFGDLSENAEYDAARNEQALIEARIQEIEHTLKYAVIIAEEKIAAGVIHLGSKVKVYDVEFDESIDYTLVGTSEADPKKHYVSNESPLGKALLGKKKGDTVDYEAPSGTIRVKVLDVE